MTLEVQVLKPHVSINVRNVAESIEFYRRMLGVDPAKVRTGYAKFDVQNPPLNLALNDFGNFLELLARRRLVRDFEQGRLVI